MLFYSMKNKAQNPENQLQDFLNSLNPQQLEAVSSRGKHTLVLAGAGTGKTKTITARAAALIQEGVRPQQIILLTFTRKAAQEMRQRLKAIIGKTADAVTAGTFHHFCLQIMRAMPKTFGEGQYILIDRDDQNELMKLSRGQLNKRGEKLPQASKLVNWYSYARNTNLSLKAYLEKYSGLSEEDRDKVLAILAGYESRKQVNKYIDYDDILSRFVEVLSENEAASAQLKKMFKHILVDEMQDTNPLQWKILDLLKDPAELFCVGDDAQSIYAFRGADFENVHKFQERVENAKVLKLERNYRSVQPILDLGNWLLDESAHSYDKKLTADRSEQADKPKIVEFHDEIDEAEWICNDIIERKEGFGSYSPMMVLVRSAWSARTLEALLVEKGIPYNFIGGTSLLQAAHVKDLLSMIRAARSHRDEIAWMRYLTLWPGIGDVRAGKAIEALQAFEDPSEAIYEVEEKQFSGAQTKILRPLLALRPKMSEPSKLVEMALDKLEPILKKKFERWDSRKKDLNLLATLAGRFSHIDAFLETYTLDPVSNSVAERVEEEDVLTLITIHSAKGTEAEVCYIIQANVHQYPHIRSIGNLEEEEEERRVLYVGITRAKDELIITRTHKNHVFGNASRSMASRPENEYFLANVPNELVYRDYESGFGGQDASEDDLDIFSALRGLDL